MATNWFLKSIMAMASLSFVAVVFYGFGLGEIGWALVPVVGVLLLVGYAVALFNIGLMLRFGQAAEIFTWGLNFLLLALSGVFNPVEALPGTDRADRPHPADHLCLRRRPRGARRRGARPRARVAGCLGAVIAVGAGRSGSSSTCSRRSGAAVT